MTDVTTRPDELEQESNASPNDDQRTERSRSDPGEALDSEAPETRPASALLSCAAVFLAASAAAWMCAGIFVGALPKLVAFIGPAIGAGLFAASYRTRRPSLVQYLVLPTAVVFGALLVLPDATGGTANLPSLVAEAIRSGGIAQPPVPFDPGWRFVLVVLTAVVAAASASLATALNRPRLGVLVLAPVILGLALVQPNDGAVLTTTVALLLFVSGLAVSYGVQLQQQGATSGEFELRRLFRGMTTAAVLVAAMLVLSQAGFLFPDTARDQVIPPQRPEVQPPQPDRVIYTVEADSPGPWRLGVLDVYQDNAWMLPPFDTSRFEDVPPDGNIRPPENDYEGVPPTTPRPVSNGRSGSVSAVFTVTDLGGHVLPSMAGATMVRRADAFKLTQDPRTGMLRLPNERAREGLRYTAEAPLPPTAQEMSAAPPPSAGFAALFTQAPPPPLEVSALLSQAPQEDRFARLQFVRTAFYENVVAAGAGEAVDLPPSRVVDMLEGGEGSPYEITAAEALLARWSGIPSRIGYGHYAGEQRSSGDQIFEVRPKHGATWLEVYFHGYGWIPIVGTPPRAKASLSESEKQEDPEVRPTDQLAIVVYAPITLANLQPLFVAVRYWVAVALMYALTILLAWSLYPGGLKAVRRSRRRRWASRHGLSAGLLVAYAEFRDAAADLNVGDPTATPLQFLESIEVDREHAELAWLVTRGLWGDLQRDLRDEDVQAAEDAASSLTRRLRRAAPGVSRLLAFGSRVSLREPFTDEIPNLWPHWARRGAVRRGIGRGLLFFRSTSAALVRWRHVNPNRAAGLILIVMVAGLLGSCGASSSGPTADAMTVVLPEPIAPAEVDGMTLRRDTEAERAYELAGEDGIVGEGRVFILREGTDVKASLQVGGFKPGLKATESEIREGVLNGVGTGNFELTRIHQERVFVQQASEQRIFLWFSPRMQYFQLFVARQGFEEADRVFASIIAFQRGEELDAERPELPDPRRGVPA